MRIRMVAIPGRCSSIMAGETVHDQFNSSGGIGNKDQIEMLGVRFQESKRLKSRGLDDIVESIDDGEFE